MYTRITACMGIMTLTHKSYMSENLNQMKYQLKSRSEHISNLNSSFDVVIVGGGATGAGIALECQLRGLSSCVLEENDFAAGASSKSTKLVHGGVRYLQQVFEFSEKNRLEKFGLVKDALRERSLFLNMCSYLTNQFPTFIPCNNLFQLGYFYMGSLVYHLIYRFYSDKNAFVFNPPRIVGKTEIQEQFKDCKATYGVLYYDGQFNDARMVQELLLTASLKGATLLNYVQVKDFIKEDGKIIGVIGQDLINKKQYKIKAKHVVNATGCFADKLRQIDDPLKSKRIIPVAGSHIILPASYGSKQWGYLIPKTSDGRVLYILPWLGNTLVGTTERQLSEPELNPVVTQDELLWMVNQYSDQFGKNGLDVLKDVKSKWCGVRPLVVGEEVGSTKEISRSHVLEQSKSGLISVMGGKWTIFRLMAQETVDLIQGSKQKTEYSLLGQGHLHTDNDFLKESNLLESLYGTPEIYNRYFLQTYGERSHDVLKLINQSEENQQRIHPKYPYTVGEIKYQIRYEMATKPEDIIFRRTRLGTLDSKSLYECYGKIFKIMAAELKWDLKVQENFEYIRKLEY